MSETDEKVELKDLDPISLMLKIVAFGIVVYVLYSVFLSPISQINPIGGIFINSLLIGATFIIAVANYNRLNYLIRRIEK